MLCPADRLFGPRVDERCRALDFILFFEDLVLGCVPPAIFLLLVPSALYQTRRQPVRVHEAPWIALKLVSPGIITPGPRTRPAHDSDPGNLSRTAGPPDCMPGSPNAVVLCMDAGHHSQRRSVGGFDREYSRSLVLAASSLLEAFSPARLVLPRGKGTITVDGCNLAPLDPASLRTRFGTVPQAPYFMSGSIRRNLDPHNTASNAEVIRILQAMSLWERIHALGGLTAELRDTDWSTGEQQLLCLGRALLCRSRILLLDEATSSMDAATATSMQHVLEVECQGCTVLAVMHQLQHVERYDLVALVDAGRIVELDSPAALLARDSEFSRLYHAQVRA